MKEMVKILMKESKETKETVKELSKTVAGLADKVNVNNTLFINSVTEEVETHYNTSRTDGKHGVIDSGAPYSVVGKQWLENHLLHSNLKREDLFSEPVNKVFGFGNGRKLRA